MFDFGVESAAWLEFDSPDLDLSQKYYYIYFILFAI